MLDTDSKTPFKKWDELSDLAALSNPKSVEHKAL